MKFIISEDIWREYEGLTVGVVIAKDIDNSQRPPEIDNLLREIEVQVRQDLELDTIRQHPNIACWHEAYRKFGANPKDFRPSNEALARLVLSGRDLRCINPLVDLYNYISLKYLLTVGGEDTDTLVGNLVLTQASGDENFIPLGQTENDPPKPGEVVYKDDTGVVCRRWNWREGDRTKLTENTKNAILVVEGLPPTNEETIKQATEELSCLVQKYCGGSIKTLYLNKNNPQTTFNS